MQTRLHERFSLGITEPGFTDDQPGLVPYDLTAGGAPFHFTGRTNVNEYAFYAQDTITLGHFTFTPGLRHRPLRRPQPGDCRRAAARGVLPAEAHRHGAPRRLFAHAGNPVQREPDPLQFHRRRRTRHQRLRRPRDAPDRTGPPQPVQPGRAAIAQPVSSAGRRLLLEVHRQRLRFRHAAQHSDRVSRSPGRSPKSTASPCASAPFRFTACRPTPRWGIPARATSRLPTAACSSTRRWTPRYSASITTRPSSRPRT